MNDTEVDNYNSVRDEQYEFKVLRKRKTDKRIYSQQPWVRTIRSYSTPVASFDSFIPKYNYQKRDKMLNISGFVVNIHDPTNYDIDLKIPNKIIHQYNTVITNRYKFKENSKLEDNNNFIISGTTYRCHLKGLGVRHDIGKYKTKNAIVCQKIKQLLFRSDFWVICNLWDIDIYNRLLVDIFIHTSTGIFNLTTFLLHEFGSNEQSIIHEYTDVFSICLN